MLQLWSYICSCLHGLSLPQRTHAAVGGFVQCSEMHFTTKKTLATKHKPKTQMIVSLDPMTLRKTCGVDSEAITIFLMVLQSVMAQKNINHGISWADSVFLGQPSPLFSDLLSVCLFAQCWWTLAPNHLPCKIWQEQRAMFISWLIILFHSIMMYTLNDLPNDLYYTLQCTEQKLIYYTILSNTVYRSMDVQVVFV